jgi:aspartate carbamoyltransferase catalytic subunit
MICISEAGEGRLTCPTQDIWDAVTVLAERHGWPKNSHIVNGVPT